MKVILSKPSGFCFGVKRAVKLSETALGDGTRRVFCLGPLIHNPLVVRHFHEKGVKVIKRLSEGENKGKVIIRTHGTRPEVLIEAGKLGIELVDATCPFVKSSQHIVKRLVQEGYQVLICGDKNHPEIESLFGFAGGKAQIIDPDSKKFPVMGKRIGILAQTTCSISGFLKIVNALLNRDFIELRVFNTICDDTVRRQKAALELARKVDLILVIGGKNSANTRRLFQICRETGVETHHIERSGQLRAEWFKNKSRIGIASGASTPDWLVEDVLSKISADGGKYTPKAHLPVEGAGLRHRRMIRKKKI
ncbi:MAG: 4-hydroxy-3-methylbut-2-enyl diphosphate reductase [Candidatus Omnitrophica bacterium]|nr:4-hydroxy-3-methylbut-2-enyl diphosphate reductase [Candidatus Omnitrophota bacterium]